MGFLNHSTNNIIVDAVLTEKGRELLSRNDGSFNIRSFVFSDCEVDYSIITKFGKTIGKEKIEKNTPVFEALTGEDASIKYPLLKLTNISNLLYMPKIVDAEGNSSYSIASDTSNTSNSAKTSSTIKIETSVTGFSASDNLNTDLIDNSFSIQMNKKLLSITGATPASSNVKNIVTYTRSLLTGKNFGGHKELTFTLAISADFTTDLYALYGSDDGAGGTVIRTQICVIGENSGAYLEIPVEISVNG